MLAIPNATHDTSKNSLKTVLVTGGAGYIGSHICVFLLQENYRVIVVDNLSNSKAHTIQRVQDITGKSLVFYQIDLLDQVGLERIFETESINSVIHLAALKSVPESAMNPVQYYESNICGLLNLLKCIEMHSTVDQFVFSSSAAVYGNSDVIQIREDSPCEPTSAYGNTKRFGEIILRDFCKKYDGKMCGRIVQTIALRYFNPVGAHPSGLIGEDPSQPPTSLMPILSRVASGKVPRINVYGYDYDTRDGSGLRDFIHVMDVAQAHVFALSWLEESDGLLDGNFDIFNLGSETGYTVLEMIEMMEKVSGKPIPFELVERRVGDIGAIIAVGFLKIVNLTHQDCSRVKKKLNWSAQYGLLEMCEDLWRWECRDCCA